MPPEKALPSSATVVRKGCSSPRQLGICFDRPCVYWNYSLTSAGRLHRVIGKVPSRDCGPG